MVESKSEYKVRLGGEVLWFWNLLSFSLVLTSRVLGKLREYL